MSETMKIKNYYCLIMDIWLKLILTKLNVDVEKNLLMDMIQQYVLLVEMQVVLKNVTKKYMLKIKTVLFNKTS